MCVKNYLFTQKPCEAGTCLELRNAHKSDKGYHASHPDSAPQNTDTQQDGIWQKQNNSKSSGVLLLLPEI
eukprot:1091911-Amphidinium_carterae.1